MASTSSAPQDAFWKPPFDPTAQLKAIQKSLDAEPSPKLRISRVAQLDADLLDNELESILAAPMGKALQGLRMPGGRSWEPELMALLRFAILKMSIFDRGTTYGAGLQNLKYRNERTRKTDQSSTAIDPTLSTLQRTSYIALLILPSYLHSRLRDRMLLSSWADEPLPRSWFSFINPRRVTGALFGSRSEDVREWKLEAKRVSWELVNLAERSVAVATLANFLIFLYDGRYRTLVDRILGMRLIYAHRSIKPNVSFEFLNRQLVWEAFTEFLLFLMPLISVRRLRTRLARSIVYWTSRSKFLSMLISNLPLSIRLALKLPASQAAAQKSKKPLKEGERPQGVYHFLPSTTCPICYSNANAPPTALPSDPTSTSSDRQHQPLSRTTGVEGIDTKVKLPYLTNCGWDCRYCYYCVVGALANAEEDGAESWTCLRCGEPVTEVRKEVGSEGLVEQEKKDMLIEDEPDEGDGDNGFDEEEDCKVAEKRDVGPEEHVDSEVEVESVGSEHTRWR